MPAIAGASVRAAGGAPDAFAHRNDACDLGIEAACSPAILALLVAGCFKIRSVSA
jgi:hypothetical protein